jgi:hypothetical protein
VELTAAYLVVGWTHLGKIEGRGGKIQKESKCKYESKSVDLKRK